MRYLYTHLSHLICQFQLKWHPNYNVKAMFISILSHNYSFASSLCILYYTFDYYFILVNIWNEFKSNTKYIY